ncbi:MAG: hypothetical protein QXP42_03065 [Candidatus Micrarchaeia archaeon]
MFNTEDHVNAAAGIVKEAIVEQGRFRAEGTARNLLLYSIEVLGEAGGWFYGDVVKLLEEALGAFKGDVEIEGKITLAIERYWQACYEEYGLSYPPGSRERKVWEEWQNKRQEERALERASRGIPYIYVIAIYPPKSALKYAVDKREVSRAHLRLDLVEVWRTMKLIIEPAIMAGGIGSAHQLDAVAEDLCKIARWARRIGGIYSPDYERLVNSVNKLEEMISTLEALVNKKSNRGEGWGIDNVNEYIKSSRNYLVAIREAMQSIAVIGEKKLPIGQRNGARLRNKPRPNGLAKI